MTRCGRCAGCGGRFEGWALAEAGRGPLCILCRLVRLARKAQAVIGACRGVPRRQALEILLPRREVGNRYTDLACDRLAVTPLAELVAWVEGEYGREEAEG